jgi:hypothetical protein
MSNTTVTREELYYQFEAPDKYVGYKVLDPEGRRVGRVDKIFTNARDEPEYVRVRVGFFGLRAVLIPVAGFVLVEREQRALILE